MICPNDHNLSTAVGCLPTSSKQQQKIISSQLPKVRYGAFFSTGIVDSLCQEEDEQAFCKRKNLKRTNEENNNENNKLVEEQQKRGGLSKRLFGKLIRLISVKEIPFLANVKTFPSRGESNNNSSKKMAARLAAARRRRQHSSQSSTLSSSFEPMPTIEEENEENNENNNLIEFVEEIFNYENINNSPFESKQIRETTTIIQAVA